MSKLEKEIRAAGVPVSMNDDCFTKNYVFPPSFVGFDGHFPGAPILPAVVQLMAGADAASEVSKTPLKTEGVSRAKFLRPIKPNECLSIQGSLKRKSEKTLCPVTITVDGERAATFTLTFSEVHP